MSRQPVYGTGYHFSRLVQDITICQPLSFCKDRLFIFASDIKYIKYNGVAHFRRLNDCVGDQSKKGKE